MIKRILQKYKSMPSQAKVVFWFTFVGFLQKGVSVITAPIFTRILSTEQYGMFSVYTAWSDVLVIIATLYLHMAVINNAFMKSGKTKEHVVSAFQGLSFLTTMIILGIYLLFRQKVDILIGLPSPVVLGMFISFVFAPPYYYWTIYERYQYDYKKMIVVTAGITVLTPLAGLAAIFLSNQDYWGEARIFGKIAVLCGTGLVFALINWKKDHTFFDKDLWKYALCFNIPLIPHFLSETILNQSDRIMINGYCGQSEAGIYSVAYSAASLVLIFSSAVNTAMVPWQYEKLRDRQYKQMAHILYFVLMGLGLLSAGMIMFAPEVIRILAGTKYSDAVGLIPTLAASVFFNYLYQTLARVEMYYDKRIYTVIGTFAAAVVNIVLNMIFIPLVGYQAAGYTTLAAHILLCVLHYFFYRRVCKMCVDGKIYSASILLGISVAVLIIAFAMMILYQYTVLRICILAGVFVLVFIFRKRLMSIVDLVIKH